MVIEQALGRLEFERDIVHSGALEALAGEDFEAGAQDLFADPLGAPCADGAGQLRHFTFTPSGIFHTLQYENYELVCQGLPRRRATRRSPDRGSTLFPSASFP